MAFRYRLQKILEFRIRKKEEQLLVVQKAQAEVYRIEQLIQQNKIEINKTRENMRKADPMMMERYDTFLKSLYDKEVELLDEKRKAEEKLKEEQEKLMELEKGVNVLEKHKEKALELYKDEEKKAELKRLSEVAVQRHFAKTAEKNEEEILAELQSVKDIEGYLNEY